jgi:hypothetical protein
MIVSKVSAWMQGELGGRTTKAGAHSSRSIELISQAGRQPSQLKGL